MSNDNDADAGGAMLPAEKLARERGYSEKSASELLQIAEELWLKNIKSARAPSKTVSIIEIDENLLEYTAATIALSEQDYIAHIEAMVEIDQSDVDEI
jgi:hypothetical protein